MSPRRTLLAAAGSLVAFAANSLLARAALAGGGIGGAGFTLIRLASGAAVLAVLVWLGVRLDVRLGSERKPSRGAGSWLSAAALFGYAIAFSWAYLSLDAGTGALLLFGTVQVTMIGWGIARGEGPGRGDWIGLALALGGLVYLLAPGITAPEPAGAAWMIAAGVAWGVYSIRGRSESRPVAATAANFARSVPFAALALLVDPLDAPPTGDAVLLAVASGAVTSGLGYVVWYAALRGLRTVTAAIAQLAVPVIAAAGGVLLLAEALTVRLVAAGAVILTGVALALLSPGRRPG